jgi:hypothetical protein
LENLEWYDVYIEFLESRSVSADKIDVSHWMMGYSDGVWQGSDTLQHNVGKKDGNPDFVWMVPSEVRAQEPYSILNTFIYTFLQDIYLFICLQQREALKLQEAYTMQYKTCMLYEKIKQKDQILLNIN